MVTKKISNLFLVTTEKFGELDCNFWNSSDEMYLTREQVGRALEYTNPKKAIEKIHSNHRGRLNPLSHTAKLPGTPLSGGYPSGGIQDVTVYSIEGVMEICRWSQKPKADAFIDFVWGVMKKLMQGKLVLSKPNESNTAASLADIRNELDAHRQWMKAAGKKITDIQNQTTAIANRAVSIQDGIGFLNYYQRRAAAAHRDTRWMMTVRPKFKALAKHFGVEQKKVLRDIYIEMEDRYGIDLEEYAADYNFANGISQSSMLDVIDSHKELRKYFSAVVDTLLDIYGLYIEIDIPKRKTMFSEV